ARAKQRELSRLLGKVFGAGAITWAAMVVVEHELEPGVALEIVASGLYVLNTAAVQVLGIADPEGNCGMLIPDELAALRSPRLERELEERIRRTAEGLRRDRMLPDGPSTH